MRKTRAPKFDSLDRRILGILQQQGRLTNTQLASQVGLSANACMQRTKALEQSGCILKYQGVVDIERLFRHVKLYLLITLSAERTRDCAAFEDVVTMTPEFVACSRVNGGVDYIALVVCASIEDFSELCEDLLTRELGIIRIDSYTVIDTVKWLDGYPLGRLEWKG